MPFSKELTGMIDLNVKVVFFRLRTQPDLLERCRVAHILLVCLAKLALLLILPLAVVHYPADRRIARRSHLHEIQTGLAGPVQGQITLYNAKLTI